LYLHFGLPESEFSPHFCSFLVVGRYPKMSPYRRSPVLFKLCDALDANPAQIVAAVNRSRRKTKWPG
jgi:hypothetical protein